MAPSSNVSPCQAFVDRQPAAPPLAMRRRRGPAWPI